MSQKFLKHEKLLEELPQELTADTIYYVLRSGIVCVYLTDTTGTNAYPVGDDTPDPFLLMGASGA